MPSLNWLMSKMHLTQTPEGIIGFDTLNFGTQFAVTISASLLLISRFALLPCSFKHTQQTFFLISSCCRGRCGILCAVITCRINPKAANPFAADSWLNVLRRAEQELSAKYTKVIILPPTTCTLWQKTTFRTLHNGLSPLGNQKLKPIHWKWPITTKMAKKGI